VKTYSFAKAFAVAVAAVSLSGTLFCTPVRAQDSASLASKSMIQVFAVQNRVFAFAQGGASYSRLDLFTNPAQVATRTWPWDGGAEGGAPWGGSLFLRANYPVTDSTRVARVTSLRFDGSFRGGDSLIFRDLDSTLVTGAYLTSVAIRSAATDTTAALAFGRLGIAYARLAPETGTASTTLFTTADTLLNFLAFPSGSDTATALYTCRWNRLCRVDTLSGLPALDSVISIAVDSSAPDSSWLLITTQKGVRRGLWGGTVFPYVALPNIGPAGVVVRSVFTAPARRIAWVFTSSRFFYSDDHGATFRVPPAITGITVTPGEISFSTDLPASAAFFGDTTYISLGMQSPGLILFRRDTILANTGIGLGQILLDTADGLDISVGEGALTTVAVARASNGGAAVVVSGSTLKGVFYRRADQPGTAFTNLNRLRVLKNSLGEVLTYPTLFTAAKNCGDAHVRIGYRLKKDSRVTITVYNYAMEKVRVVVRNAPRQGGIARSENLAEDRWDGCDASGRFVSVGTYYILVESDQGEKAFGKSLVTRGRK
jgi:hypothetical protein